MSCRNCAAKAQGARNRREQFLRSNRLGYDLISGRVLRVGREVETTHKNGSHARMAVLHLVPEREAVHRLHDRLRDQHIHGQPLHQVQRFIPSAGGFNFMAGSFLENVEYGSQVLLPIHNENLHGVIIFTYPTGSSAAGFS